MLNWHIKPFSILWWRANERKWTERRNFAQYIRLKPAHSSASCLSHRYSMRSTELKREDLSTKLNCNCVLKYLNGFGTPLSSRILPNLGQGQDRKATFVLCAGTWEDGKKRKEIWSVQGPQRKHRPQSEPSLLLQQIGAPVHAILVHGIPVFLILKQR